MEWSDPEASYDTGDVEVGGGFANHTIEMLVPVPPASNDEKLLGGFPPFGPR